MNDEVIQPQGEDVQMTKVIWRNVEVYGKVLGYYNDIPMLNTILYDIQFPYGAIKPYSENLITENILTQVDDDGYHNHLLKGILDHSRDKQSLEKKDKWIVTNRVRWYMQQTTGGLKFRVKWKDGTATWISLKDRKESNPIEVAEYVTARNIQD